MPKRVPEILNFKIFVHKLSYLNIINLVAFPAFQDYETFYYSIR